jgi:hypothetical protein
MPIDLTTNELELIREGLNSRDVSLYSYQEAEELLNKLRRYEARCQAETPQLPFGDCYVRETLDV